MYGVIEVVTQAEGRLRSSSYQALKQIDCGYREGVLTLRGRVSSYYHKQLALALVCGIDGVQRIDDRIEVVSGTHSARHEGC